MNPQKIPTWKVKGFNSAEEYNAFQREYRAKNQQKWREYKKKYNSEWRKKNGYQNEENWKKNNPQKLRAQMRLQTAVRRNKLSKLPCSYCGDVKSVAHHPDYSKPLEVIWVCKVHHRQIHYGN